MDAVISVIKLSFIYFAILSEAKDPSKGDPSGCALRMTG
jgi:hypothetical protein